VPQREAKALNMGFCKKQKSGKRRSMRSRVLSYIKRNRVFRVGDLEIIFELKISYLKWLIWSFSKEGLIVLKANSKRFEERYYVYRGER
jgi:hypothetical protein